MAVSENILSFSLTRPRTVMIMTAVLVLGLGALMPLITIDTDPENMLPEDQPVRVFHHQVKADFALNDFIVVGIVNTQGADGVFTPEILGRVHSLTQRILEIDGVIARDVLSLATVDDIRPEGPGTVRFQWLMKEPPPDAARAREIREAAERNPTFMGTLISEDGQATAIYVPIRAKHESHRIATEIEAGFADFDGPEEYHITGLPVAEDTFGVEMFMQMGIAAPLAALIIFILMWVFFRSLALITSPMILAMGTVIATMGALIGCGFTVHIMSSMIPIFLMPIAVVDSVHILSEFADCYPRYRDREAAIRHVVRRLFTPMLYTSLTSAAGFASLAFAPIPPVQVFGIFVAIGILLAFVLTITFIPAYVTLISEKRIAKLGGGGSVARESAAQSTRLGRLLEKGGRFAAGRAKLILVFAALLAAVSAYGISRIEINDNPVRWFRPEHRIRVADRVLNEHFGGTYNAFLVLQDSSGAAGSGRQLAAIGEYLRGLDIPEAAALAGEWEALSAKYRQEGNSEQFEALVNALLDRIDAAESDAVYAAWERALDGLEASQSGSKTFTQPTVLAYVEKLQQALLASGNVGKSNALPDIVKTVNRELHERNTDYFTIPPSQGGVAQVLLTYESSHRPHDLWHFVTPDYAQANIWLQLKSGDNQDMQAVVDHVKHFVESNPPPPGITMDWAGLTYINVVWQGEMVSGMRDALLGSFVIVFIMMLLLFRSFWFGLLAMLPLSFTIAFVYGMIGLAGKDYDMPIAVLSSLTLGLSVDFAIHFLQRCRSIHAETGNWRETMKILFAEPARAITRNAIIIAIGFLPLLASPLVPYNTVGIFLALIMLVSCSVTLLLLPAIIDILRNTILKSVNREQAV